MPSQPLMNDNNYFFPGRARKLREAREKREERRTSPQSHAIVTSPTRIALGGSPWHDSFNDT